jgi:hypothetical protein
MLSRRGWIVPGLLGAGLAVTAVPAQAQSNIDAGKTPAQIFSDTCNACHRSPRELKPTNASFLREHYTTGAREAAAMAAYVTSVGSDPQAVRNRRPPVMGAGTAPPPGQAPAAAAGQASAQGTAAALRARRPSESLDATAPFATLATGTTPPPAEASAPPAPALEPFEE